MNKCIKCGKEVNKGEVLCEECSQKELFNKKIRYLSLTLYY